MNERITTMGRKRACEPRLSRDALRIEGSVE